MEILSSEKFEKEVSRGHSVVSNEPLERTEVSQTAKDRTLSRFQFNKGDQIKSLPVLIFFLGKLCCLKSLLIFSNSVLSDVVRILADYVTYFLV